MINEMRIFFSGLILGFSLFLASCESTQVLESPVVINDPILIEKKQLSAFEIKINSVLNDISAAKLDVAQQKIDNLNKHPNNNADAVLLAYTLAKLKVAQNRINEAYEYLNNKKIADLIAISDIGLQMHIGLLNADILTQNALYLEAVKLRVFIAPLIEHDHNLFQDNHNAIWSALNHIPQNELDNALEHTDDSTTAQWLSLNIISRNRNLSLEQKSKAIEQWYLDNPAHPAKTLPLDEITTIQLQAKKQHQVIAVILPFKGKYSAISEAITDGFMKSCYDSGYTPLVRFYNADESASFVTIYEKAIADGANLVIGPLLKTHLDELYKVATLPVQTIALNKLPLPPKKHLFQYSIGSDDEIAALIKLASINNLANAFVLAQNDEFSQKNYHIFTANWKASGAHTISAYTFSETADLDIELENPLNLDASKERIYNIENLLGIPLESEAKSRSDIDIIVLLTKTEPAREINALLNTHFSNTVPKYSISSIYRGFPDLQNDQELNDIIFTEMPLVIASDEKKGQKYSHSPLLRLFALGMDTFELNSHLEQMQENPDYTIHGSSGEISLINGELFRKPALAIFSNGKAIEFSSIPNSMPKN